MYDFMEVKRHHHIDGKGTRVDVVAGQHIAAVLNVSEDLGKWGERVIAEMGLRFTVDYDRPGHHDFYFTVEAAHRIVTRYKATPEAAPLQIFEYHSAEIRTVTKNGEPWFVAADVCAVLCIGNSRMATGRLDADEKGVSQIDTPGGRQDVTIINESGLYSLILRSDKPEAKQFKKWVTSIVLPTIRRTGGYTVAPSLSESPEMQLARAVLTASSMIEEKNRVIEDLTPRAAALSRLSEADGSLTITNAAKDLQVRPKDLFHFLSMNKWVYRRTGSSWIAYQDKIQQGLLEHKVSTISMDDGSDKLNEQVRITAKGMAKLAVLLPQKRISR